MFECASSSEYTSVTQGFVETAHHIPRKDNYVHIGCEYVKFTQASV